MFDIWNWGSANFWFAQENFILDDKIFSDLIKIISYLKFEFKKLKKKELFNTLESGYTCVNNKGGEGLKGKNFQWNWKLFRLLFESFLVPFDL